MATVSSLGAGSGLDLSGLLSNIMQAEQKPLLLLQSQEASYQSRISALGSLQRVLSALQTSASSMVPPTGTTAAAKYTTYSASVADTSIATASASSGAVAGSYSLSVSSLAQNQRLVSPSSAGYTGSSSVIGTGDLKIEFGSLSGGVYTADGARTKTITIDSTNATLGGLRDAINKANAGVSATIVSGTGGAQLVLTSNSTGLSNVMRMSGLTGFDYDPAADTGTLTQSAAQGGQAASNAAFTLNGIAATSSTNSVSNVLDGVTLNLLKTTSTATTLTVSKNTTTSVTSALTAFVKAYNDANTAIQGLGAYDPANKTAGALQGDSTLRGAKSVLQNLVFGASAGGTSAYQRLADIGVSLAKDGSLSLDSSKLATAAAADPTSVANVVAAVGSAFKTGINSLVGTTGSIAAATDSANRQIKTLTARQDALSTHLVALEANYRKQFTALDSLIAGMKDTSNYLTQQLASLPGVTSSTK